MRGTPTVEGESSFLASPSAEEVFAGTRQQAISPQRTKVSIKKAGWRRGPGGRSHSPPRTKQAWAEEKLCILPRGFLFYFPQICTTTNLRSPFKNLAAGLECYCPAPSSQVGSGRVWEYRGRAPSLFLTPRAQKRTLCSPGSAGPFPMNDGTAFTGGL